MEVLTSVDEARCKALRERDEFFWADLVDPAPEELRALGRALDLHPLALEDTDEFGQPPKLDRYEDHVLLVFYAAREAPERTDATFVPLEVHLYIAGGFVLTVRREPFEPLERLHARIDQRRAEEDVVYAILDTLADALLRTSERIETRIDALEAAVLERVDRAQSRRIYWLKQEVRDLQRRAIAQHARFQGDVEAILAVPGLQPGRRRYLNDVRDHLEEAASELTRQLEDLQALTSTYFNANAQRLNVLAARLSIVATFFLVWTLITSFFGQNFGWLTGRIDSASAFWGLGVGGLVVSTALTGAVLWWRRRDLR